MYITQPPVAAPAAAAEPEPEPEPQGVTAVALYECVSKINRQVGGTDRAVHSYDAAEDNELTFREGDRIVEIEAVSEDWWQGRDLDGNAGLFPGESRAVRCGIRKLSALVSELRGGARIGHGVETRRQETIWRPCCRLRVNIRWCYAAHVLGIILAVTLSERWGT